MLYILVCSCTLIGNLGRAGFISPVWWPCRVLFGISLSARMQRQETGRLMFDVRMSLGTNFNQSTRERNRNAQTIFPAHHHFSTLTMLDAGFDTSFQTSLANATVDGLIAQESVGVSTPCP
jgi:hypothetical protein